MLDIKFVRENLALVEKGARDKGSNFDFKKLLQLDEEIRALQTNAERLQADRNRISKDIGKAAPHDREALKEQVAKLKPALERLTGELRVKKEEFDAMMGWAPQPAREDVPLGKSDAENVEVKKWGEPPKFDFTPKDHVALGEALGIIDIPRGVKIAGSRSYVLKGDGARLEQALMRYSFDKLVAKGYTPLSVPVLVKKEAMEGTGYFPAGKEQAYMIDDEAALVGTSEVSIVSIHADEILAAAELPLRYLAQSSCFRREAGTYGKDTHGLYRVHQFQKIEQVIIAPANPSLSDKLHEELLTNAEEIMQDLGLAYRVVYVCTGDLGQGQVRKHDIEAWMPSRNSYSETHSCSTFYDFQARRSKIRYKDESGQNTFCYTLNNTAIASPRVLIPLLEAYQQKDGSVAVPKCLQPYMQGQTHLKQTF